MRQFLLVSWLLLLSTMPAAAGIRGAGDYAGVVVFDRWDDCFLVSGPYLMYIADQEKEKLRTREGEAVLIHASDVLQWINPGDGVIRDLTVLGVPPEEKDHPVDGVELETELGSSEDQVVRIWVTVRNQSRSPRKIWLSGLAPTLFYPKDPDCPLDFSEGLSEALITRGSLEDRFSQEGRRCETSYRLTVQGLPAESRAIDLDPGASLRFSITLELPPGSYDFLMAYGRSVHQFQGIASNRTSFDVTRKEVLKPILSHCTSVCSPTSAGKASTTVCVAISPTFELSKAFQLHRTE